MQVIPNEQKQYEINPFKRKGRYQSKLQMESLTVIDEVMGETLSVYVCTRCRKWFYLSDPLTSMPILICIDSIKRANESFMRIVNEVFEQETVDRIQIAFDRDGLFEKQKLGEMVLICGVIAVRIGSAASIPVIAHECVHISQFMLSQRMDITDFRKRKAQELQADIVERFVSVILQLRDFLLTKNRRKQR